METVMNDLIHGEPAPQKEEDLYRLLVENANEAIYVTQNGRLLYTNPKSFEISGYSEEELTERSFVDLIHPEDRQLVYERHIRRMRGEKFVNVYSHRIIDKQGNVRWLEINVVRIMWNNEPAILNFASDITDRKQAEDALSESEERYRFLFHSAPAGVFYYDTALKIMEANDTFVSILGAKKSALFGLDLNKSRDKTIIPCLMMPLKGKECSYEGWLRPYMNSHEMWVLVRAAPLYGKGRKITGGIGIIQDMTYSKKAEEELKNHEQEIKIKSRHLEEANAALRVLLRHRDEDRLDLQRNVISNIRELVMPYVDKLKYRLSDTENRALVDILETNLRDVSSPFLRNMTLSQYHLTPKEIQVANLIREGKSTKDIARMMHLSTRSVEYHRDKIRNRIGLKNQKVNLRSYLLTLS